MKWLDKLIAQQILKRVRKEIEMNGWKTKIAGIGGILGGLAVAIGGIVGDKFNFDAIQQGIGAVLLGLGALGIGHKIDKNTAAVQSSQPVGDKSNIG
jgi:ABC-type uncharacterized transport system permease subunit